MEVKRAEEDRSCLTPWQEFVCQCIGPGERAGADEAVRKARVMCGILNARLTKGTRVLMMVTGSH